jgi:hypothetical protein
MIKLTDLLKEEETFTATSKKSGETAVFKTKDARDAAVKAGTHSKIKDSEDGDDKKDTPKVNIFDKPKKDEPKKDEPVRDDQTDAQIEDVQNNIDDMPGDEIQDYAESDIFPYLKGRDLELAKMYVDDIDAAGDDFDRSADLRKDLKDLFDKKMTLDSPKEEPKGEEPKKDEPVRDEYSDAQIDDVQNNIGDLDGDEMRDYAESDIFPYLKGKDLETAKMFVDDIEDSGSDFVRSADVRADLKDLFDKKMSLENTSTNLRDLLPESIINEGTRSQVGVIGRNGKIVSAYVHYDGYPSNMKPGLKHHMKSDKDVLKLIKMGGARGIFDDKEIEYYKNGKPTKGDMKDFGKYVDTADRSGGAEYIYLYNMKDKKWYFADVYGDKKLKKLF